MRRVAIVLLLSTSWFVAALPAVAVTCGTRCEPDGGGSGYSSTVAARPKPNNDRGNDGQAAEAGPVLLGSESYNYGVPLLSLPGRNGLDLNLTLYYNSHLWTITSSNVATFNADRDFPSYGFRLGYGYLELSGSTAVLTEADGSKRNLVQIVSGTLEADDASYTRYYVSSKTVYYRNGLRVLYEFFPGSTTLLRPIKLLDTNGNFITITYRTDTWARGQDIATITDTVGRVVTFNYDASGKLTSITQGSKTFTFSWNTAYTLTYSFSISVTNSPASGSTHNVLTGVTLPNGARSSFLYGDWGIVNRIEARSSTGALRSYTSYNYPAGTVSQPGHPTFTQRTLFDGSNTAVWAYSSTKSGVYVSSSTVTDPTGTKTVTNLFTSGNFLGLSSTVELRNASNTLLRTASYTWLADANNRNARLQRLTSTLSDSGQQSKAEYTYDAYGNVTELQEFDFGLQLKRRTATTYLSSSVYLTARILNRPTQVLVKDAAGAVVARSDFAYDTTNLTAVTGATQHDDTNYSATYLTRGNVTSVTRYTNAAAGSGAIARNFYYDTLGNLRTADLDCCNQRQWSYTATTQYSLPETVTSGPVGTQLTTSATYNLTTGTVATSTDENGKTTSFQYDVMDRLTQVTQPGGVVNTASFNDADAIPVVTQSSTANSLVQVTVLDGLGRPVQGEVRNGTTTVSTVNTFYDAVGRPSQVSNPYGPGETAQWTATTYDALGRPTQVTPPGSAGSYTYSYSGNQVTVTDPAG
ncbi:MAG: hypothetical protein L0099_04190, partial [Acidobacteria bacterium]|nr:hypothetical protein [Acidobacteriota bacterium]